MSDTDEDRWEEIKIIQDSFFKTAGLFTQWYSWFMGVQIVTLGLILSHKEVMKGTPTIALGLIWIAACAFSIPFVLLMGVYQRSVFKRMSYLLDKSVREPNIIMSAMPSVVWAYAFWAISGTITIVLLGWFYTLYWNG